MSSAKTKFVRSIVREVVGFSPYERRVMELLRNSKVRDLCRVSVSNRVPQTYDRIYSGQESPEVDQEAGM